MSKSLSTPSTDIPNVSLDLAIAAAACEIAIYLHEQRTRRLRRQQWVNAALAFAAAFLISMAVGRAISHHLEPARQPVSTSVSCRV